MTRVYVVICTKCNEEYIGMLDKGKEGFKTEFELVSMKISDAPIFKTVLPILAAPHFWGGGGISKSQHYSFFLKYPVYLYRHIFTYLCHTQHTYMYVYIYIYIHTYFTIKVSLQKCHPYVL